MTISETLLVCSKWLIWSGGILALITFISFLFGWGVRFRLTGTTIFTFLLAGSCWAFVASYSPPYVVEGALYAPVVYDNGNDLVVAQASDDFPPESIQPTIEQIAGNLKGGGRKGQNVHVRLRKVESISEGLDKPIILAEIIRNIRDDKTISEY
tara:strand:+ start:301 stop:762 length:462 start_codon:yes stop_codon:yes gene_type:complete